MPEPAPAPMNPVGVTDLTGKTVGRFVIRARLGGGGMGEVYRADDTQLKRPVALKRIAPRLQADMDYRQRFLREAQCASALTNQHVAGIYDVLEDSGEMFLVMEYVEGVTLRQRLAQPVSIEQFLGIAVQCASALVAAHERGILHRDLKPENIMLTPAGQVKILDFGVAKQLPRTEEGETGEILSTGIGPLSGTLAYMAPEVLLEKQPDQRADIFSLGLISYEALTGRHPFLGGSLLATSSRILHDTPAPLTRLNPKVSGDLERIVAKMLAKDPNERYATAADLLVDLRAVQRAAAYPARKDEWSYATLPRRAGARVWTWAAATLVVVLLVVLGLNVGGIRRRLLAPAGTTRVGSIAVLPLQNLSHDPEQDYFADGITDALITELASISALRVVSRTSAMQYKGAHKPLSQIGRELKVDAVVEGSVLRSADRVRITAELVHVPTDRNLWAKSYERDLRDVLALQSEVARTIAQEINIKLTPHEQALLSRAPHVNPDAYQAYLKGRFYLSERTPQGLQKGLAYFQQAVAGDPSYALAYAGLADAHQLLASYDVLPSKEAMPKAAAAARRALDLDPTLGEAYTSLAMVKLHFDWDWTGVEWAFRRAFELNPGYAEAHHWYALYLSAMGQQEAAIAEIKRALDRDPLSPIINANLAWCDYLARRYDAAIEQAGRTLEMYPEFAVAHEYLGQAYAEKSMFEEALAEFRKAAQLSGGGLAQHAGVGYVYARWGKRAEALRVASELKEKVGQTYHSSYYIAAIYAGLGDAARAMQWLEKSYEERDALLVSLKVHPMFERIRSDASFQDLLRRMGLAKADPGK